MDELSRTILMNNPGVNSIAAPWGKRFLTSYF